MKNGIIIQGAKFMMQQLSKQVAGYLGLDELPIEFGVNVFINLVNIYEMITEKWSFFIKY